MKKFWFTFKRDGIRVSVDTNTNNALAALEVVSGFIKNAFDKNQPVEFVSLTHE